jgi:hypothetical protein
MPSLDIATTDELIALLDRADQASLPSDQASLAS